MSRMLEIDIDGALSRQTRVQENSRRLMLREKGGLHSRLDRTFPLESVKIEK